jgi:hypothetical protein
MAGALVSFNEHGHVLKISLAADFSTAIVSGLVPDTTPALLVDKIHGLGFAVGIDSVRMLGRQTSGGLKATVKMEDPLFARSLADRLKDLGSDLSATPALVAVGQANFRKVHLSWHKSTRSVWLDFGNGVRADRVASTFNESRYKILRQPVRSSPAEDNSQPRGRGLPGRGLGRYTQN